MTEKQFKEAIDDDKYHFFVLASPAKIPFHFTKHTWIVIKDENGKVERRDLAHFKNKTDPDLQHIQKNFLPPRKWLDKYFWESSKYFPSHILYHAVGEKHSPAYEAAKFVQEHITEYPDKDKYYLIRKNSNSFVKWVLRNIPSIHYTLPRNIIG